MGACHGTTILSVRKNGQVVVGGDGQVSLQNTILKPSARKVRKLAGGKIIAGFAGSTADALTLLERLETKLERQRSEIVKWMFGTIGFQTLIILGATGDLTKRLLLPALSQLLTEQPERRVRLVGAGNDELSDRAWRTRVREAAGGTSVGLESSGLSDVPRAACMSCTVSHGA